MKPDALLFTLFWQNEAFAHSLAILASSRQPSRFDGPIRWWKRMGMFYGASPAQPIARDACRLHARAIAEGRPS